MLCNGGFHLTSPGDLMAPHKELLVLMTATVYDDHSTPRASEAEETDGRYSEELHDQRSAEA